MSVTVNDIQRAFDLSQQYDDVESQLIFLFGGLGALLHKQIGLESFVELCIDAVSCAHAVESIRNATPQQN